MAWIHPVISGDYRILGVTSYDSEAASDSLSNIDSQIATEVAGISDLNSLGQSWLCLGSDATTSAVTRVGSSLYPFYNTNGVKVADSTTDLWDGTIDAPIDYRLNGTQYDAGGDERVYTGSFASGNTGDPNSIGGAFGYVITGLATEVNATWITFGVGSFEDLPYYAVSGTLSTISGSLSGTVSRSASNIWAVGNITLTGDVDFGGDVDILEALDVTQIPPTPSFGFYKFNVGPGGTAPVTWPEFSERISVRNSGASNTIEGLIGDTIVSGGVVYE